jgi:cytochrome c553
MRKIHLALVAFALIAVSGYALAQQAPAPARPVPPNLPEWAWGVMPPAPPPQPGAAPAQPPADDGAVLHIEGSNVGLTRTQLRGIPTIPDWHPEDHGPMPDIVSKGRMPAVRACGFCHLPNGRGRPENAAPAGLSVSYITQQMQDFKNGLRRSSDPRKGNVNTMAGFGKESTPEEVKAAAEYFAALPIPQGWVKVKEVSMVPKTKIQGNVYFELEGAQAGKEPIGNRIIEVPEHGQERFEMRDAHAGYIAYVPVGAVKKGEALANKLQCSVCHGANLEGIGPVPSLAGRSPSYMARQLFDFQTGARQGLWSGLMKPIVAKMTAEDLVNITAYIASKNPPVADVRQTARAN